MVALVAPLEKMQRISTFGEIDIDVICCRGEDNSVVGCVFGVIRNLDGCISNNIAEGQQVSTTTSDQSGIGDGASQGETIVTLTAMQETAFDTSSDINGVIATVSLNTNW